MKLQSPTSAQWRKLPRRGDAATRSGCLLVVWHALPDQRVGLVVNKGFGNAVRRNKLRRRLREAATQTLAQRSGCWLVIAQDGAGEASVDQFTHMLERAAAKIGH
jgi:ribonuclease P protein component